MFCDMHLEVGMRSASLVIVVVLALWGCGGSKLDAEEPRTTADHKSPETLVEAFAASILSEDEEHIRALFMSEGLIEESLECDGENWMLGMREKNLSKILGMLESLAAAKPAWAGVEEIGEPLELPEGSEEHGCTVRNHVVMKHVTFAMEFRRHDGAERETMKVVVIQIAGHDSWYLLGEH
jgi:hypothetical protein